VRLLYVDIGHCGCAIRGAIGGGVCSHSREIKLQHQQPQTMKGRSYKTRIAAAAIQTLFLPLNRKPSDSFSTKLHLLIQLQFGKSKITVLAENLSAYTSTR
jgi:hypothetical protein